MKLLQQLQDIPLLRDKHTPRSLLNLQSKEEVESTQVRHLEPLAQGSLDLLYQQQIITCDNQIINIEDKDTKTAPL